MIRWHTDPQVPPPTPKEKELSDIVDSNSYGPLYLDIQSKINNPIGLDKEDVDWLQSIVSAFDVYVTQILHAIRLEPWDYEHRIRDEYTKLYGQPLSWDVSIRTVIGRLLTYKEIWSYQREAEAKNIQRQCGGTDWFWRRPEPKPIWNVGCLSNSPPSGGSLISSGRELQLLTGINPKNRRQVYHVTYQRPWGLEIDPAHNWGVFIDQTRSYSSDAPIRVLMACCGEHVGATEGCWIALKDDDKAVEGVIKPYDVYVDVFDTIWTDTSNNSPLPSAAAIAESFRVGTAFQDVDKYEALHQRIKKALQKAAPVIRTAYEGYQTKLQTTLDTLDEAGDAKRDTNPFESILTKEEQEVILLPIRLKREYNAIQCVDTRSEPPTLQDYVNERVFKVQDMLREFTFEKMGGIEVTLKDETTTRIKMLKTQELESVEVLNALINIINAIPKGPKREYFKSIRSACRQIIRKLEMLNNPDEIERAERIRTLLEKYEETGQNEILVPPEYLDIWTYLVYQENQRQRVGLLIKEQQSNINTSLRSLKSDEPLSWRMVNTRLPKLKSLLFATSGEGKILEDMFEENMDVAIISLRISKFKSTNVPDINNVKEAPEFIKDIYRELVTFYKWSDLKKPAIVFSKFKKVNDLSPVLDAKKESKVGWRKLSLQLQDVRRFVEQIAAELEFINSLPSSERSKQIVVSKRYGNIVNGLEETRYNIIEELLQIQKAFQKVIKEQEAKYVKKQEALKTEALNTLALLPSVLKIPDAPDKVKEEVKKILGAVQGLNVYDEWVQKGFNYDGRVQELLKQLPVDNNVFTPTLAHPTVDALKAAYLAKWTGAEGLLGAANALAAALAYLLQNLEDNNAAKEVNDILNGAENQAAEALNLIESPEARQLRLEQERRAKEKIDNQIKKDVAYAKPLLDWLKNPVLQTSGAVLGILSTLQNNYRFEKKAKNVWEREEKLREGAVLNDFIEISDAFGAVKDFFRPSRVPGNPAALPSALSNDASLNLPSNTTEQVFSELYVEGYNTQWLINVYRLYTDYLIKEMYVNDEERDRLKKILLLTVAELPPFPEQPRSIRVVPNPNDTFDVSDVKIPVPPMIPGTSIFTFTTQDWIANSCWLDSAIVSLFSVPQTTWVKSLFEMDRVMNKGIELQFNDASKNKIVPNTQNKCASKDIIDLHSSLLEDILFLQQASTTQNYTCKVRTRLSSAKGCLKRAPLREGEQESPATFYDSFVALYGPERLGLEFVIQDWETYGNTIRVRNPLGTTKAYVVDVSAYMQEDAKKELAVFKDLNVEENNFKLAAIVVKSGSVGSGHFTTFLYDFASKRWAFFNIGTNDKQIGWVDNLRKDTDVYGVPRETLLIDNVGLPVGIFNFEGIKSRGVFNGYKPAFFVFIRQDEIEQILVNLAASNVSMIKVTPTPTPLPSLPLGIWASAFDTIDVKIIRKTLRDSYDKSANPKKIYYATALNLLHNFEIPNVARASPLRYAYAQFNAWLQNAQELTEIRMRKAMVAAQVSKEDDSQLDLSPLGIVRLPDDTVQRFYVKELLKESFRDDDHRERRKRIYAVLYQIDFSKLEK